MINWDKIRIAGVGLFSIFIFFTLVHVNVIPLNISTEIISAILGLVFIGIIALFVVTEFFVLKPLKEKLSELKFMTDSIINSSEDIMNKSQETTSSSEIVSKNLLKVSKSSNDQSEMISQTYKNLEQISELIDETEKRAAEGTQLVDTTINSMESINEAVSGISREVDELNIDSNKISIIVELITEIASQTNLLSLNAAVEAARAGEHGRGFNIVAEEVRKLARQSEDAAKQAYQLVNSISSRIEQVADCTEQSVKQVKQGSKFANDTSLTFYEIKNLLAQQVTKSKDILSLVNNTLSSAKTTSEQAYTIAGSAEEQHFTSREFFEKSQELVEIASDLSKLMKNIE